MQSRRNFAALLLLGALAAVSAGLILSTSLSRAVPSGESASPATSLTSEDSPASSETGALEYQPQLTPQGTPQERTEGTFAHHQRVVVGDLPSAPAAVALTEETIVLPRRAPELSGKAYGAQVATANAVNRNPGLEFQPMAPPDIFTSFDGLDSTDNPFALTPPDPQIAVGPNHVVEFVNVMGRITDKSGVPVSTFLLDNFFGTVPGAQSTDPKIIYDDLDDRFFATYIDIDFVGGIGDLYLAISDSSDPTLGWTIYSASFAGVITDYEAIGLTSDKVTVSSNLFDILIGLYIGEQTIVFQKSDLLAADLLPDQFLFPIRTDRFTVRPAHHLSPGNDQYLTTFDISGGVLPATEMTVIRITGTPDAGNVTEASATDLPVIPQDFPPPSLTAGPGFIHSGDFRMLEAVWRDNSLWSSASAACLIPGDAALRSCAHLIEVETVGAPSVVQDIMFGAEGQYYSWPAIRTDSTANLYVSFTGTHGDMFASAQVAGRLASDPPNTMAGSCLLKPGEIVHDSPRWGDYLGAAVDPSDPSTVWVVGEYAKNDGSMRWGTYIGSLSHAGSGVCPQKPPPPTPPPPKGNDNFADAVVIPEPLPFANAQDTTGSTMQPGEPSPCAAKASTVWYSHTPSGSGTLIADTFGSSYDTALAVYTGDTLGTLVNVGCNDDTGGFQSQLTFAASAGVTYHFQLGGYFGSSGNLVFNLTTPPPPPTCPPGGNDGFEAGSVDTNLIPCWTVVDQAGGFGGSWCNQTGTATPQGTCSGSSTTVAAPPEGLQAAMTNQSGAGSHVLYRCDILASGLLSFDLYINNEAGVFFSPPSLDFNVVPNQQFRADLVTKAGITADPFTIAPADVLLNIYQTQPGDPPVSGYTTVTADVSAHVGQNVCLRFAQVDNQFFFHAGVDAVQFDTTPKPTPTITPTPTKQPAGDTDGDGCTDQQENGLNQGLGGLRDYLDYWDFYDTPDPNAVPQRDKAITVADMFRVAAHFGDTGDPNIDPLSKPTKTGYHTAFDRGGQVGANIWNQAPADGAITVIDIFAVAAQFGHSCL